MWCRSASYALFNRFAVRKLFQNDFCLNADEEGEGVDERGMQKIFTPTSCQRCMCIRQWAGIKKLKKATTTGTACPQGTRDLHRAHHIIIPLGSLEMH